MAKARKVATISVESCKDCEDRIDASWKRNNRRNIYCDNPAAECRSITEADDKKGFPDWCPIVEKPLKFKGKEVVSFSWKGNDNMLGKSFCLDSPIPRVHKDFEVKLRLKDGSVVDAPAAWRKKVWAWWIDNRRSEVMVNVLRQYSNQVLGRR